MHSIPLYLITFNCARLPHPPDTLSPHLLSALSASAPPPELIVLSLQELAPLAPSFLGGSNLTPYYTPFSTAVRTATRIAFNEDYSLIAYNNVGLTAIMIFARHASNIKHITYGGVGTGLWAMGNKGSVGVRLGYTIPNTIVEMTFLAVHLAPHEHGLSARNANWEAIARGLVFAGEKEEGMYTATSHLFVLGDLNYRTADSRPGALDHLVYPQPGDAVGANTHFLELLKQDQLSKEVAAGKTLQGLVEERVTFPPTYKYKLRSTFLDEDVKEEYWEWSKRRWPSWTDRIFYLQLQGKEKIVVHNYTSIPEIRTSDHRPVALHVSVPGKPVIEESGVRVNPPWGIDKDWRVKRAAAKRKEVAVGVVAWLVTTRNGLGVFLALVFGAIGGWWMVKELMLGVGGYTRLS